jgi:NAD-dependent dihydropyrimidine dehydrogenase PreA subunit
MKKYKVRLNCNSFVDVVVLANNKKEAINEAYRAYRCADSCPQNGFDFGEFLDVDDNDEPINQPNLTSNLWVDEKYLVPTIDILDKFIKKLDRQAN